jgi:hypothetical protein
MSRWLWKICEVLTGVVLAAFVIVPSHYELEFVKGFYTGNPLLCVLWLVFGAALVIATIIHAIQERQKKKAKAASVRASFDRFR